MIAGYSDSALARPRGGVTIPRIWITIALSVLLHALLLWQVKPDLRRPSNDAALKGESRGSLSVQIAPPFRPPAPPRLAQRPQPPQPKAVPRSVPRSAPREAPRPKPAPRPPPPPVIAMNKPQAEAPARPPPERPAPAPAPRVQADDLGAMLEARRRARGESPPAAPAVDTAPPSPPSENANERANRMAAANLGTNRAPTFGEARRGGGVFTIRHVAYDYAEFLFYGWNKDIKRNTAQVIEVRKGNNADIRIAVVRRMIGIIRDYEQNDFTWESPRLGRNVTLSARQRDTAGLEAFLMREFFEDDRRP